MKAGVNVKVQTGYFERTDFKMKAGTEGFTFTPAAKGGAAISISAENIKSVTFQEVRLKMEIQANDLTETYFTNAGDWFDTMKVLKEKLGAKVVCEMN